MKTAFCIILIACSILACQNTRSGQATLTGAYVREYTGIQKHSMSDKELGTYMIRDTIFIEKKGKGYEILNHKWRRNGYDKAGWQDQRHSLNRPLLTYQATYDPTDHSFNPVTSGFFAPLYLDPEKGLLYKGGDRDNYWEKVE